MLIVVEGADGSGKDTIADAVAQGLGAERLSFPNDAGVTGPAIRSYLRREWTVMNKSGRFTVDADNRADHLSAMAFQALQVTNRMEVMPRLIQARDTDQHLVLARYWQSGWVYGQLDGLDEVWLHDIHKAMAQPQVNILLDVDAEVALARRASRDGQKAERYEGKLDFTRRVVQLYRDLWNPAFWERSVDKQIGHWVVIDASGPVSDVIVAALGATLERMGGT